MTTETKKQLYEGMYILSGQLSDEARKKALEKLEAGIKEHNGEVKKVHEWGRRRLTYEINGHREGYYYILYFECDAAAIKELWHDYHLNEDLVRFMTLQTEEIKEKIEFKSLGEQ